VTRVRTRDERGSAVVEFVALGVLLLLPLVYLVLMLARVQAGAYSVSQAARESGRAFVTAADGDDALARARAAAAISFLDHDFADSGRLSVACDGTPCLRPDGRVQTTATVQVPLPLVPGFARRVVPLSIPVSATHVSTVDRFRGLP
jgi:Flp pilus assembly protein TadG